MAVYGNIIPHRCRGPTMMWSRLGVRAVTQPVHKNIRPGRERLRYELMPVLTRVTISDHAHLVIIHHKRIPPAAGDNGNGIETLAIRHSHPLRPAVEGNAGISEVLRHEITRPRILDIVELNKDPAVIFIRGVAEIIRPAIDMFDAAIGDAAGPCVFADRAVGISRIDSASHRRSEEHTSELQS